MKKKTMIAVATLVICCGFVLHLSAQSIDHSTMDHSKMMIKNASPAELPTEAGNDVFGTVQEIVSILLNDPNTNWGKVNLEALRSHLLDMQDMTLNVEVISQTRIDNGLVSVVKPTTGRAIVSLKKVFGDHPKILMQESGFDMEVKLDGGQYTLTTTTANAADVAKIQGLGYIGLMAFGNHHQPHHLSLAKGLKPHS